MYRILVPLLALLSSACFIVDFYSDGGETGGQDNGFYYCTAPDASGRWLCLLNSQSDPRVQAALDQGLWQPWTDEGTCPHRRREWDALRRIEPVDASFTPLRAAECSDDPVETWQGFSICLPTQDAWGFEGVQGAVARGARWEPNCESLEPFALAYPYKYAAPCAAGVTCLGFDSECTCKCEDSTECGAVQTALEETYFGEDPDGLIPGGWELACTGYPWKWDPYAYGSGGYVGTACEWNQAPPAPGEVPWPLVQLIDDIECLGDVCEMPVEILDTLTSEPWLLWGSSSLDPAGGFTLVECNHVCSAIGLAAGDEIVGVGLAAEVPTFSSWFRADSEFRAGQTALTFGTATGPITITFIAY